MYIEFSLPKTKNSIENYYGKLMIKSELEKWYAQYQIKYRLKDQKNIIKLTFSTKEDYSFWALTWLPQSHAASVWRFVEPMNKPKSFD